MGEYIGSRKLITHVEAGLLILVAIALALVVGCTDALRSFDAFLANRATWQLHEIFAALLFCAVAAFILVFRRARDLGCEVERREQAEECARLLARHDPLTGLPNRRLLTEELGQTLEHISANGEGCAIFLIALAHLKAINEVHGHEAGDAILLEVTNRLKGFCGSDCTVSRLEGDQFACVATYPANADSAARLAAQIIRDLSQPFEIGRAPIELGPIVGIARCPQDGTASRDLLRAAEIAMHEAKRDGKGAYRFFHIQMDETLRERVELEQELRSAIEDGAITPYFQPIVLLDSEEIHGFEMLARWEHPTRGLIPPDTFIPIAEDLGLVDLLSYGMLRAGARAARDWPPHLVLGLNISPIQLKDPWMAARLLGILAEADFPPTRLAVEVTESAVIDVELAVSVFTSLRNSGVQIALDDFGKGFSSLCHLRQLRFDHLKIDSSFVLSLDSGESRKIVKAIIGLGGVLDMPVTAEGVECRATADVLRSLGCKYGQGYFFGIPKSAAETNQLFWPLHSVAVGNR